MDKNKIIEMSSKMRLSKIAESLGYNNESVIFLRNGVPIPDDEVPNDGDEIIIMKAFSGG